MIIIWGYKATEKKLGYVADYCANCKDVRTVKIIRVGRAFHLYYLPFGDGDLVGYDGVCRRCELRFGVRVTDYASIEKDKHTALVAMVEKTNPRLMAGNEAAVALWRRISEVSEPFTRYDKAMVRRSLSAAGLDWRVALAVLATILVPLALVYLAGLLPLPDGVKAWGGLSIALLFCAGMGIAIFLSYRAPQRYFRATVEGPLAQALRPLAPTREELEACVGTLKEYGYRIGKLVSVDRLLEMPGPAAGARGFAGLPTAGAEADPAPLREAAPAPVSTLVLSHGGKEYRFSPGVADIVIGRSAGNAIVIPSKYVSRTHAQISWPLGSEPGLRNLGTAGTSLAMDGRTERVPAVGEVILRGSGSIGLAGDFAEARAEGDVLEFRVVVPGPG